MSTEWEHSGFSLFYLTFAIVLWKGWESRRDFQGLWKGWETCTWFSKLSISAVAFHSPPEFIRRRVVQRVEVGDS